MGVLALLAGRATGAVRLSDGTGVPLIVAGLPLVTHVALKRVDQYSHVVFGTVSAIPLVLGLQLLDGDVVGTVLGSEQVQKFLPILGWPASGSSTRPSRRRGRPTERQG